MRATPKKLLALICTLFLSCICFTRIQAQGGAGQWFILSERGDKIDAERSKYPGGTLELDELFEGLKKKETNTYSDADADSDVDADAAEKVNGEQGRMFFGGCIIRSAQGPNPTSLIAVADPNVSAGDATVLRAVSAAIPPNLIKALLDALAPHLLDIDIDIEQVQEELLFPPHTLHRLQRYDLIRSADMYSPHELLVGRRDPMASRDAMGTKKSFLDQEWRPVGMGAVWAIELELHRQTAVGQQAEGERGGHKGYMHRLVVNLDRMGMASVFSHTWLPPSPPTAPAPVSVSASSPSSSSFQLRVMTYNLWHHNPPAWMTQYRDHSSRWGRYWQRLLHFARVIVEQAPDVIFLQEVRLDNSFRMPKQKQSEAGTGAGTGGETADAGGQMQHVLQALKIAECEMQSWSSTPRLPPFSSSPAPSQCDLHHTRWQYVYQPAMNLAEKGAWSHRHEEGVAILSRGGGGGGQQQKGMIFPLRDIRTLYLPRALQESKDDHQRVVLHAVVRVGQGEGGLEAGTGVGVGVGHAKVLLMTSHFSLWAPARDLGVRYLLQSLSFPHSSSVADTGMEGQQNKQTHVHILGGDLNAEPEERSLQILVEEEGLFKDSFVYARTLATGAGASANQVTGTTPGAGFGQVSKWASRGLTFPTCNPVKRIDFLLIRNSSSFASSGERETGGLQIETKTEAHVLAHWEIGTHSPKTHRFIGPTPIPQEQGDEQEEERNEDLGMLDETSPLWASDHFGVVTDILIVTRRHSSRSSSSTSSSLPQPQTQSQSQAQGSQGEL